jgi:DNA repair exonuclease SbcCD ATPase subunit
LLQCQFGWQKEDDVSGRPYCGLKIVDAGLAVAKFGLGKLAAVADPLEAVKAITEAESEIREIIEKINEVSKCYEERATSDWHIAKLHTRRDRLEHAKHPKRAERLKEHIEELEQRRQELEAHAKKVDAAPDQVAKLDARKQKFEQLLSELQDQKAALEGADADAAAPAMEALSSKVKDLSEGLGEQAEETDGAEAQRWLGVDEADFDHEPGLRAMADDHDLPSDEDLGVDEAAQA